MSVDDLAGLASEAWMGGPLCAQIDSELFFSSFEGPTRVAKSVCGQGEVLSRCRAWVLRLETSIGVQPGVYAQMTEGERRELLRGRCREPGCGQPARTGRARYCTEHAAAARIRAKRAYQRRRPRRDRTHEMTRDAA